MADLILQASVERLDVLDLAPQRSPQVLERSGQHPDLVRLCDRHGGGQVAAGHLVGSGGEIHHRAGQILTCEVHDARRQAEDERHHEHEHDQVPPGRRGPWGEDDHQGSVRSPGERAHPTAADLRERPARAPGDRAKLRGRPLVGGEPPHFQTQRRSPSSEDVVEHGRHLGLEQMSHQDAVACIRREQGERAREEHQPRQRHAQTQAQWQAGLHRRHLGPLALPGQLPHPPGQQPAMPRRLIQRHAERHGEGAEHEARPRKRRQLPDHRPDRGQHNLPHGPRAQSPGRGGKRPADRRLVPLLAVLADGTAQARADDDPPGGAEGRQSQGSAEK